MIDDPSSSIANSPLALDQTATVYMVQQFTYLGSVIAADGSLLPELQAKEAKASAAMGRLNSHPWRKPCISRNTMLQIFNALVETVILYGTETWPAPITTLKTVDMLQTKGLRRIQGLRWVDSVSNERLLQTTQQTPFLIGIVERTLRRYGHLLRMPSHLPAKIILDFSPETTLLETTPQKTETSMVR